jgi:beta-lactamase regulating signal transducer with metallopeptidase domain/outer membrane lipoprotein-sorting protein
MQLIERVRLILCSLGVVFVLPFGIGFFSNSHLRFSTIPLPFNSIGIESDSIASAISMNSAERTAGDSLGLSKNEILSHKSINQNADDNLIAPSNEPSAHNHLQKSLREEASRFSLIDDGDIWRVIAFAIIFVHAIVTAFYLASWIIGRRRLAMLCRNSSQAPMSMVKSWSRITNGKGSNVRLLVSNHLDVPLMFGWRKPTVIIPSDLISLDGLELEACLSHEWSHIVRSDILTWYFVNLLQIGLWYQPAFWKLCRELRLCQEQLADSHASNSAIGRIEYSELLLKLTKKQRSFQLRGTLTMFDRPSQLARRLHMLLENSKPLRFHCRRGFSIGIFGVALITSIVFSSVSVDATQTEEKAKPSDSQVTSKDAIVQEIEKPSTPKGFVPATTYVEEAVKDSQLKSKTTRVFLADDGRTREELENEKITIVNASGDKKLVLDVSLKRATVLDEPTPLTGYKKKQLQRLKDLGDLPDKALQQREFEGKLVNGAVVNYGDQSYTIWTDVNTRDLVRVEYDRKFNDSIAAIFISGMSTVLPAEKQEKFKDELTSTPHITMREFKFDERVDENLFSFEIPDGYTVTRHRIPQTLRRDVPSNSRTLIFRKEMLIDSSPIPVVVKNCISDDGRKRMEHGHGKVTILDSNNQIRVFLDAQKKTARIREPLPNSGNTMGSTDLRLLKSLKKLSESPDKELGQKEIEGRMARGFEGKLLGTQYQIWTDANSGDIVRVEYEQKINDSNAHITMSELQYDEMLDESLFSFEAPEGYETFPRLKVGLESDSADKRANDTPFGMKQMWSRKGAWSAVAATPPPSSLYLLKYNALLNIDGDGFKLAEFPTVGGQSLIRVANFDGDDKYETLQYGMALFSKITAQGTDGKTLWTYPGSWGVTDFCAVDLDQDHRDEVIVGFGGSTGLHAIDSDGQMLWKNTSIGNVWHVAAGNLEGDAFPEIVSTSAKGIVHIFDRNGESVRTLDPGFYANMVRISKPDGQHGLIIAGGSIVKKANDETQEIHRVAALDSAGNLKWTLDESARIQNATTSNSKPWVAISNSNGTVRVIDVLSGKEIANVGGQGERSDVAWLSTSTDDALLVITNRVAVSAYRIVDSN